MKILHYSISQFALFLLLVLGVPEGNCADESLVQTKQGTLSGIPLTSRKGRTYYGFLGISYGKIAERFAVGEKSEPWDGVKDAKMLPPPCFQYFSFSKQMMGVEDCLQLNVYSPKPKNGEKMPVMVWIFPGGFQIGGASMFEAKYLMDQDVVYVSINYRLGALGFLNTGDGTVSGNMGLKDQVLALQWVQENIESFGGDPNLVTIFGLSAGGASVDYLTISPMAKGLFHRAISMSGSSLNPWAFQPQPTEIAKKFAEHAECSKPGWKWPEKVACLRLKEPSDIVNAQLKLMKLGHDLDFIHMKFVPSVESKMVKGPRFLTDSPYNSLERGEIASRVPYLAGHTENEGSFYVAAIMQNKKLIRKVDKDWMSIAPDLFYYENTVNPAKLAEVSESIRDFYLGGPLSQDTKKGFTDIYSDRFFTNGIALSIQLHAKYQDVFPYILDYQGQYSFIQFDFEGVKDRDGVGHADDMMYIFNATVGGPEIELGTKDGQFSEKLLTLLVSFAKNGKPTATWGRQKEWPIQGKQKFAKFSPVIYYKLDLENTEVLEDPWAERRHFWYTLPIDENEKAKMANVHVKDEL